MLNIAICDDNYNDIKLIVKIIEEYFHEKNHKVRIKCFCDASSLLLVGIEFDLLILDIMLGKNNGLNVAKKIYYKFPKTRIVFYSIEVKFAPISYESYGSGFILKPALKKDVFLCLDRILKLLKVNNVEFKDEEGITWQIDMNKILYIYSEKRYTNIYLENKHIKCLRPIKDWLKILPDKQFTLGTRGVIVNLHAVASIDIFDIVHLKDGSEIKLSVRLKKEFRNNYNLYWGQML